MELFVIIPAKLILFDTYPCVHSLCCDAAAVVDAQFTLKNYPNVVIHAHRREIARERERERLGAYHFIVRLALWQWRSERTVCIIVSSESRASGGFCLRRSVRFSNPGTDVDTSLSLCETPVALGRVPLCLVGIGFT